MIIGPVKRIERMIIARAKAFLWGIPKSPLPVRVNYDRWGSAFIWLSEASGVAGIPAHPDFTSPVHELKTPLASMREGL